MWYGEEADQHEARTFDLPRVAAVEEGFLMLKMDPHVVNVVGLEVVLTLWEIVLVKKETLIAPGAFDERRNRSRFAFSPRGASMPPL